MHNTNLLKILSNSLGFSYLVIYMLPFFLQEPEGQIFRLSTVDGNFERVKKRLFFSFCHSDLLNYLCFETVKFYQVSFSSRQGRP